MPKVIRWTLKATARFNFSNRAVAGHHNLLSILVKRVEGVEKFVLNRFLACDELNVIQQQVIQVPEFLPELLLPVALGGLDELVYIPICLVAAKLKDILFKRKRRLPAYNG